MLYTDYVSRLHITHPTLADTLRPFVTLEHVLNWMPSAGLPFSTLDMVTQDEYCHDLLLPLGTGEWLVFGMT